MADDLTNPLVRLITERIPWLFADHRFKIVDYSYDARSFGNCIVTLESEALRNTGLTFLFCCVRY